MLHVVCASKFRAVYGMRCILRPVFALVCMRQQQRLPTAKNEFTVRAWRRTSRRNGTQRTVVFRSAIEGTLGVRGTRWRRHGDSVPRLHDDERKEDALLGADRLHGLGLFVTLNDTLHRNMLHTHAPCTRTHAYRHTRVHAQRDMLQWAHPLPRRCHVHTQTNDVRGPTMRSMRGGGAQDIDECNRP